MPSTHGDLCSETSLSYREDVRNGNISLSAISVYSFSPKRELMSYMWMTSGGEEEGGGGSRWRLGGLLLKGTREGGQTCWGISHSVGHQVHPSVVAQCL